VTVVPKKALAKPILTQSTQRTQRNAEKKPSAFNYFRLFPPSSDFGATSVAKYPSHSAGSVVKTFVFTAFSAVKTG
jgi:hypothetical protein